MFNLNPFADTRDSKRQPYSRLLRSSLFIKLQDTWRVIFGNSDIIDSSPIGDKIGFFNFDIKLGLVDYTGLGIVLKGILYLSYGLADKVFNNYRFRLAVKIPAGIFLAVFLAPLALAFGLATYAVGLAAMAVASVIVSAIHAVTAITSYKSQKLVTEMFQKGLIHQEGGELQIISNKGAKLFYREFRDHVDRDKPGRSKVVLINLHKLAHKKPYILDQSVVSPGSYSMFADRLTDAQRKNLTYTNALKQLNMFNEEVTLKVSTY